MYTIFYDEGRTLNEIGNEIFVSIILENKVQYLSQLKLSNKH